MDLTAIQNFRGVDRLLNAPEHGPAEQIRSLGPQQARQLLRYQAGEMNRLLFEQWERAQIAIGLAVLLVLVFGRGEVSKAALILTLLMLAILAADRMWLTPKIAELGRFLDYSSPSQEIARKFWALHGTYSTLELLKIAAGLGLAVILMRRHTDRGRFVRDYANASAAPAAKSA